MVVPKVDLKMGTAILQIYEGGVAGLSSFIDSVQLFVDTTESEFRDATVEQKAAAKDTVLRFVKTRLTGKARAAIGENPIDIDEILRKLKEKCGTITSPDVYMAKLLETKQTDDINKFTSEVENLVFLLEKAYISENIPVDVASKMAVKQGVKALCSGVKNNETKLILKSGQFTTLSAAIEKTVENESSTTASGMQNAKVLHVTRRGFTHRGRGNSHGNRGNRNQGYYGYQQNFPNNRGRGSYQRNSPHNYQNLQSDYQPNFNYQRGRPQRGGYRGNMQGNMQPRIFYASAGQNHAVLPPQPVNNNTEQQQQPQQHFLGQLQGYVQ